MRSQIEMTLMILFCVLGISLVFIIRPALWGTINILLAMVILQLIVLYNQQLFGGGEKGGKKYGGK